MKKIIVVLSLLAVFSFSFLKIDSYNNQALAQDKGMVPGNTSGIKSDTDLWKFVRTGKAGSSQMKDEIIHSSTILNQW